MADEWKTLLAKSQRDIEKALESDFSGADVAMKQVALRSKLEDAKYRRSPEYLDYLGKMAEAQSKPGHEARMAEINARADAQKDVFDYKKGAAKAGISKPELNLMLGEFDSIPDQDVAKAMKGWAGSYAVQNKRYPSQKEKAAKLAQIRRAFGISDAGGDPSRAKAVPGAGPDRGFLESAGMIAGDIGQGIWDIGAGLMGGLGNVAGEVAEGDIGGAVGAGGEMAKAVAKGALVEGPGQLGAAIGSFAGGAVEREGGPIDKLRAGFHELADYLTQGADEAQIRQGLEQGAGLSDEAVAFLGYANDVLSAVPGIDKMSEGEVEDWFVKTMSEDPNSAGIILDLLGAGLAGKGGAKALRKMGAPDMVLRGDPNIPFLGKVGPQTRGDLAREFAVDVAGDAAEMRPDLAGFDEANAPRHPIQQLADAIDPERLAEAPEPVLRALADIDEALLDIDAYPAWQRAGGIPDEVSPAYRADPADPYQARESMTPEEWSDVGGVAGSFSENFDAARSRPVELDAAEVPLALEDMPGTGLGDIKKKTVTGAGDVKAATRGVADEVEAVRSGVNAEMAADAPSTLDKISEATPSIATAIVATDEALGVMTKNGILRALPYHSKFSTFRKLARDLGIGPVIDRLAELQHFSLEATNQLIKKARKAASDVSLSDADDLYFQKLYEKHRAGSRHPDAGGYAGFAAEARAAGKGHIVTWYDNLKRDVFDPIRKIHGEKMSGREFYFPAHLWHEPPIVGSSRFSALADNFRVADSSKRLLPQKGFSAADAKPSRYWIEDYIRGEVNKLPGGKNQASHLVAEWIDELKKSGQYHGGDALDGLKKSGQYHGGDALDGLNTISNAIRESIGEHRREFTTADRAFETINRWLVPDEVAKRISEAKDEFQAAGRKLDEFMAENGKTLEGLNPNDSSALVQEFGDLLDDLSAKRKVLSKAAEGTAHQFIYDFFGRDPVSTALGTVMGTFVTSVLGWRPLIHGPMQTLDVMSLGPILTADPRTVIDGIKSLTFDVAPTLMRDFGDKIGFTDPVLRSAYDNVDHLSKLLSGEEVTQAYVAGRPMPDAWDAVGPMVRQDKLMKSVKGDSLAAKAAEKLGYIGRKHDRVALAGLEYFEEVLNKTTVKMADAHFQRQFKKHGNNMAKLVDQLSPVADDATKVFWKKLGEKNPIALRNEFARWYTVETFVGRTNFDHMIMYGKKFGATDMSRFADFQRALFTRHPATRLGQLFKMVDAGMVDPKKAFWMASSALGGMAASYAIMRTAMPFEGEDAVMEKTLMYGSAGPGYDVWKKVSGDGYGEKSILDPKNITKAIPVIAQTNNALKEFVEPMMSGEDLMSGGRKKFLGMKLPAGVKKPKRKRPQRKRRKRER